MSHTTLASSDGVPWIGIASLGVPALVAIISAVLALIAARQASLAQEEVARLHRLEERVAARKYEVYAPILEMYRQAMDHPGSLDNDVVVEELGKFWVWISIFGSDEAIRAYRNLRQAGFSPPPGMIIVRLYADFVIAARKDMGDPDSTATPLEILGGKIDSLYSDREAYETAALPFAQLCGKLDWKPPWLITADEMTSISDDGC